LPRFADSLSWTVRTDESRVIRLQPLEFFHQAVVLEVADLRRRFDVVLLVVIAEQAAQLFNSASWIFGHGSSLGAALRRDAPLLASRCMGNEAEELQRLAARIAKLMHFVRFYEHHIARS